MCAGSSARASGLRKLQFALYILDTRVRAVVENLERQPPADALLAARDGPAPRREALALVLALRRVQVLLAWPWSWASRSRPRSSSAWR